MYLTILILIMVFVLYYIFAAGGSIIKADELEHDQMFK